MPDARHRHARISRTVITALMVFGAGAIVVAPALAQREIAPGQENQRVSASMRVAAPSGDLPRIVMPLPWKDADRKAHESEQAANSHFSFTKKTNSEAKKLPQAGLPLPAPPHGENSAPAETVSKTEAASGENPREPVRQPQRRPRVTTAQRPSPPDSRATRRTPREPYQQDVREVRIASLKQEMPKHRPPPDEEMLVLEHNLRQIIVIEDKQGLFTGIWIKLPGFERDPGADCAAIIRRSRAERRFIETAPRICRIDQMRRINALQAARLGRNPDGSVRHP